ncbi:hypothetical protein BDY19DRAFT_141649 [Irpex rosettiformis]|uniref:Uncharacterized protein n=1 Tax=Irpex rosettiformis TaxID=378272 RepID=A0ACB8TLY0_9APHY|nr:hypothetical protein BDY19DRAFT_141649 [Irpex rosettiformis]
MSFLISETAESTSWCGLLSLTMARPTSRVRLSCGWAPIPPDLCSGSHRSTGQFPEHALLDLRSGLAGTKSHLRARPLPAYTSAAVTRLLTKRVKAASQQPLQYDDIQDDQPSGPVASTHPLKKKSVTVRTAGQSGHGPLQ